MAEAAEPGSIRVLLSQQASPSQMEVGIYGSYLLNDSLSFQRGSTLRIVAQGTGLMVYYEGLIHRAGPRVILKRYGGDEGLENGLRLSGSLNLHEGDLHLTVDQGSIRAILHIGIEDYLKGVVPYEMADSFPLEALKAQAVTARSYALRSLRSDRDFDLYDTPDDQVYRGLDAGHSQAIEAVRQTQGIAISYQGKLAQTFYSASNGGQTESAYHAWGREQLPYTRITPDPYDLENPASQVRRFDISKQWAPGSAGEEALDQMLRQALAKKLELPDAESVEVRQVIGLKAVAPRYDAPSQLMTRLRFDLLVNVREIADAQQQANAFAVAASSPPEPAAATAAYGPWKQKEEPVSIELDIFPGVEQSLGLSINSRDNEIVRVEEDAERFIIISGRHGHGVGMSQRGAEWMAKTYAWNHSQILAFYYPGTELRQYQTQPAERPRLAPSFLTTPGPPPTPTPRPTLVPLSQTPAPGQWLVEVTGIARNSTLNLRAQPSLGSEVLQLLYYGQRLLVISEQADGWLNVRADGLSGWVMASFTEKVTE